MANRAVISIRHQRDARPCPSFVDVEIVPNAMASLDYLIKSASRIDGFWV